MPPSRLPIQEPLPRPIRKKERFYRNDAELLFGSASRRSKVIEMSIITEMIARGWENFLARPTGPFHFRFVLQPAIASLPN